MFRLFERLKKYMLAGLDVILIAVAYFITVSLINTDKTFGVFYTSGAFYIIIVTYLAVFFVMGVYQNIIRYASVREYVICFFSCLLASVLVSIESQIFPFMVGIRLHLLAGILAGVLCVGLRVMIQSVGVLQNIENKMTPERNRLLIIGAGNSGDLVIRELLRDKKHRYDIIGLIDDDHSKIGCNISGIKVLGSRGDIRKICKDQKIDTILFAIPSAKGSVKKEILEICNSTKCKVLALPSINDLITTKRLVDHIRKVEVTDLLNRDPVKLNNAAIGDLLKNHVVLVTGGGGSIGSELCRQIAKFHPAQLLILDIYENNAYDIENELKALYPDLCLNVLIASVRERARMEEIFSEYHPSIVFHAAAHKHVPLMEHSPKEAIKNNVFGTLNVAECADRYGVQKFVLISTDKAVNPTNIMGASKRICEMIVQDINNRSKTEYAAVRFGNVLGSNGSVVPLFKKQIAEGGPVTVTDKEVTRFFMTIPEAAQLVLQAGSYARGGEIFVLDMGSPVKIYDLAENLIKLSGLEPGRDIEITVTGLRPGEKLYEELLMSEEGLSATQNEKIFISQPLQIDEEHLKNGLHELSRVICEGDNKETKETVARLVETYFIDYCNASGNASKLTLSADVTA